MQLINLNQHNNGYRSASFTDTVLDVFVAESDLQQHGYLEELSLFTVHCLHRLHVQVHLAHCQPFHQDLNLDLISSLPEPHN